MGLAILVIMLIVIYAIKAASIVKQHDEIIADDVMMCWEPPTHM